MHMMDATRIAGRLAECGLDISFPACEQLERYHCMLIDWNTRMDLTAVTDEEDMLDRHYVDSLMALTVPGLVPAEGSLIDVGTGAGFPGALLAIASPEKNFVLLDSTLKRLKVIDEFAEALQINNITTLHARAEEINRKAPHNGAYDLCVSRAVADLSALSAWCLFGVPFVICALIQMSRGFSDPWFTRHSLTRRGTPRMEPRRKYRLQITVALAGFLLLGAFFFATRALT